MKKAFEALIKPQHEQLKRSLGIKKIEVREVKSEREVEVRHLIKCLNPFNEEVYITEAQFNAYENLGLSIRRA